MNEPEKRLKLDQPAVYQICLQTEMDLEWEVWFENMSVTVAGGTTTITGTVADQPALHSLLIKIRNLGLPLISLTRIDE